MFIETSSDRKITEKIMAQAAYACMEFDAELSAAWQPNQPTEQEVRDDGYVISNGKFCRNSFFS